METLEQPLNAAPANPDPLADLQGYLHAFKDFISKTAVAIGVTHMDRAEAPDLDAYRTRLASLGHQPPPAVFRVDARSRDDVAMLVKALLYTPSSARRPPP